MHNTQTGHDELGERFDYVHNVMKLSHDKILQTPDLLLYRRHKLRQRHQFLKFLGKDQFDETKSLFIPLKTLLLGSDKDFVINVCDSTPAIYDNFLKTL